jgi:hypothetical protein
VKSRGAGGDDTPANVDPLCRLHHSKWHSGELHVEIADREARIG